MKWTEVPMVEAPRMPDLPEPTDLPKDAEGAPLGGDAKWTRYTGAHRACDRCIRAISQGVMRSHPLPARRKRTGPTSNPELLCTVHGELQETRDTLVKQRLAGQRASTRKVRR
jgi:hypothetical protein